MSIAPVVGETYRVLAVVPADVLATVSLPARASERCPACNLPFAHEEYNYGRHVRSHHRAHLRERFCAGGRYGFLWLRRCRISEPHMHQRCKRCCATWISAPHSEARYA